MNDKKSLIPIIIAVAIFGVALVSLFLPTSKVSQQESIKGLPNLQAGIASTSAILAGPAQIKTIFQSKYACASRIISTGGNSAIMISFDPNIAPNGVVGHLQLASTTVAYNSELYGCGAVTAYGFSSSTITVSDFGL